MPAAPSFGHHTIGGARPADRVEAFAASVRARSARPHRPRREERSARIDTVLLRPLLPLASHHWHYTGVQAPHARVTLAMSFPTTVLVRPGAGIGRHPAAGARPDGDRGPTVPRPAAPRVLAFVQHAMRLFAAPPRAAGSSPREPQDPSGMRPSAPTSRATPSPVAMVQRRQEGALPDASSAARAPVRPPSAVSAGLKAHWDDGAAVSDHTPGALTASDLPAVVDHVVREIDRRLVAARERRGWVG